jgi:hypothetical protein
VVQAQRDLRIDFFRGLALFIVLVDHVEEWAEHSAAGAKYAVVQSWTLISLGFSDAAEIFVFLSGFVFAAAYSRALDRGGFWECLKKSLRRSAQIYLAYVAACLAVIALGAAFVSSGPPKLDDYWRVGHRVADSVFAAATLRFHPWGFDVLAMYVLTLPAMAVLLYVRRILPPLAWTLSGGLYLAVQWRPDWNLHRFGDDGVWYFNPLAWQFLFFLGMCIGDPRRKGRFDPVLRKLRPVLVPASIAMLAFGAFILKGSLYLVEMDPEYYKRFLPMYRFYWAWGGKTSLQPLRLAHFFALAYLTSRIFRKDLPLWSTPWARPVVVTGQHSLEVYAFGLVLSFCGAFLIIAGWSGWMQVLLIDLLACAASVAFAYGVRAWRRRAGASANAPTIPADEVEAAPQPAWSDSSRRGKRRRAADRRGK